MVIIFLIFIPFNYSYANELHDAALKCDIIQIKKIITVNPELINVQDLNGHTALLLAIAFAQSEQQALEAVATLVNKDNINLANNEGNAPLRMAIARGYNSVARLLLSSGANVSQADNDGNTHLHIAQYVDIAEDILKMLLANGANINAVNNEGATPLYVAVSEENLQAVKWLIKIANADFNIVDVNGYTPLYRAAWVGNIEIVKYLLEVTSADVNAINKNGYALLHVLVSGCSDDDNDDKDSYLELISWLIEEKQAEVNIVDRDGNTPLHLAALYGNLALMKLLYEKGANVNAINNNWDTPLHMAASSKNINSKLVKWLIETAKAVVRTINRDGFTPLQLATNLKKSQKILQILTEADQKVLEIEKLRIELQRVRELQKRQRAAQDNQIKEFVEEIVPPAAKKAKEMMQPGRVLIYNPRFAALSLVSSPALFDGPQHAPK